MKLKRLMRIIIIGLGLLVTIAGTVSAVTAGDVKIIANKNVPASSISSDMLKEIFLGKKNTWDNGMSINYVTLDSGETHNDFLKTYLQKSDAQFNNYWKKQVFTGQGQMPKAFNSDKAMIDFVAGTNGAIGYVSSTADTGSVKTITVK
ncbi:MAG: substrate-binding domain-containing protein [Proteobacteria bacterium]|nr:substrate-binding domain-containing protein [Pseudomonadota bacterium]MBU4011670.1 substrate-binding domain-containing protein [Pseudomonadota bacterium]